MLRKTFFYCAMKICISFILFRSNRVWIEKDELGISFNSYITKQALYSVFHNRPVTLNFKQKLKGKRTKTTKSSSKISKQHLFK